MVLGTLWASLMLDWCVSMSDGKKKTPGALGESVVPRLDRCLPSSDVLWINVMFNIS